MKKILLTLATPNLYPHCQELLDNQQEYAAANGYEHRVASDLHWTDMHPSFSKVYEIDKAMQEGYDYIIWADADVAFTNFHYDFLQLLEPDYFAAAYWQQNWKTWQYLCNGLIIWRNTEQAREYVRLWTERCLTKKMLDPPWEQWSWDELMRETNYAGIRPCNAHEIGCFSKQIWHDGVIWQPGMPTVHLAGPADWPTRRQVFLDHYQKHIVR